MYLYRSWQRNSCFCLFCYKMAVFETFSMSISNHHNQFTSDLKGNFFQLTIRFELLNPTLMRYPFGTDHSLLVMSSLTFPLKLNCFVSQLGRSTIAWLSFQSYYPYIHTYIYVCMNVLAALSIVRCCCAPLLKSNWAFC